MELNARVWLKNRNNGVTGYRIEEKGIRRQFAPGERKPITFEELQLLQYTDGGDYLIKNLFIVEPKEALEALDIETEPEYFYTETEIRKILLGVDQASLDQLTDMLNFAPEGVIELAKDIAVKERIPDSRKRKLISKKTGFNVDGAINLHDQLHADDDTTEKKEKEKKVRKSSPITPAGDNKPKRVYKPAYTKVEK